MQLRNFLSKVSLFIILGILIFILLSVLAESQNSRVEFRVKQLLEKADSVEALAVGNSHACALDFKILGLNGYRIAQGGNDLFEVEYQLRSLLPLLPNIKIVFINLSYFSLHMDNAALPSYYSYFSKREYKDLVIKYPDVKNLLTVEEYPEYFIINTEEIGSVQKNKLGAALDIIMNNTADRLKLRQRYYNSIPSYRWVRGDFKNFFKSKLTSILREDHWKSVFFNLFSLDNEVISKDPEGTYGIDTFGQFTNELVFSYQEPDSLELMARDIQVPMYHYAVQVMSKYNPEVVNQSYEMLVSIVNLLRTKGIQTVIITTPVHGSFTKYFNKDVIKVMHEKMKGLKTEYKLKYFDYSVDSAFAYNYKYFYNSDHLNKDGASELSKKLLMDILKTTEISNTIKEGVKL